MLIKSKFAKYFDKYEDVFNEWATVYEKSDVIEVMTYLRGNERIKFVLDKRELAVILKYFCNDKIRLNLFSSAIIYADPMYNVNNILMIIKSEDDSVNNYKEIDSYVKVLKNNNII